MIVATVLSVASVAYSTVPRQRADTAVLLTPRDLPELNLANGRSGTTFGKPQLKGRWTLLYSGYLNCPDLCPTTLGLFARLNRQLQQLQTATSHTQPQFVFISIDHFRDSGLRIADYAEAFDPAITPLTGTPKELQKATTAFGFIAPPEKPSSNVAHSSAIALIGPNAQLRALFRYPHDQAQIVATLLKTGGSI